MNPKFKQDLRWVRLDNAAKIYPASRTRRWSNVFRLSATLTEPVDTAVLQSALDVMVPRFPTIAARLRRGVFWYYLQQLQEAPKVLQEYSYPLAYMHPEEARRCAFRVIVHKNRIAAEFFHSLTDGTGGLIFLKSLVAEYLQQKYGVQIPPVQGVLDRQEAPSREEMEDSFLKYAGPGSASRKERDAWHFHGTLEPDGQLNLVCLQLNTEEVLQKAHEYDPTLTGFLSAVLMSAILSKTLGIEYRPFLKYVKAYSSLFVRAVYSHDSAGETKRIIAYKLSFSHHNDNRINLLRDCDPHRYKGLRIC